MTSYSCVEALWWQSNKLRFGVTLVEPYPRVFFSWRTLITLTLTLKNLGYLMDVLRSLCCYRSNQPPHPPPLVPLLVYPKKHVLFKKFVFSKNTCFSKSSCFQKTRVFQKVRVFKKHVFLCRACA